MPQILRQALVTIPGTDVHAHPINYFPGTTAEDLIDALNKDPKFPVQVSITKFQLTTILNNGSYLVFKPEDDLSTNLEDHAILSLMPLVPPPMGLTLC